MTCRAALATRHLPDIDFITCPTTMHDLQRDPDVILASAAALVIVPTVILKDNPKKSKATNDRVCIRNS